MPTLSLKEIKRRLAKEKAFFHIHFGGGPVCLDKAMQKKKALFCGGKITNDHRARVEISDFKREKPQNYFAYISAEMPWLGRITNWTGITLAECKIGNTWRNNFGDLRTHFYTTSSINGIRYYGYTYGGNGTYCRLYAYKKQGK